jgi:hypothetical protein
MFYDKITVMKQIFLVSCLLSIVFFNAFAVDWWTMPTICKPDQTNCYSAMSGAGFDSNEWDVGGNCRGKKLICPYAIIGGNAVVPTTFAKSEISDSAIISTDFDTSALDVQNGCFGLRKTQSNGTEAKVGSEWRKVYCNGIFDDPDEILPTGEIKLATAEQPTCETLKENGYIGILNGSCYGAYKYPPADFYLECSSSDLLPSRIVVLNGASDTVVSTAANPGLSSYPIDEAVVAAMFEQMIANAAEQQRAHATQN